MGLHQQSEKCSKTGKRKSPQKLSGSLPSKRREKIQPAHQYWVRGILVLLKTELSGKAEIKADTINT